MTNKVIIGTLIFTLLLFTGCSNKELVTINAEKEELTNEISQLKKLISEKDEKLVSLEEVYSNKLNELRELTKSLEMVRASANLRLGNYSHSFNNLENIYKIHSNHVIKDDWYVINDDYFQIELLEYENAKKVDFYTLRTESDEGVNLVFSDTDSSDGWFYTNENISMVINKHKQLSGNSTFEPYFIIYTEVTLENGDVIRTSKLPIYNQ